jgi:hypothetical protein
LDEAKRAAGEKVGGPGAEAVALTARMPLAAAEDEEAREAGEAVAGEAETGGASLRLWW